MTASAAAERLALRHSLRASAVAAWERGLRAACPHDAVLRHLRVDGDGEIVVLGWGKAAMAMLRATHEILGSRIASGLVVVPDGHSGGSSRLGSVRIEQAAHPIPDGRSERLAREMLAIARGLGPGDTAVVLGSGGGSSLLACPVDSVPMDELARLTSALIVSGAGIEDINAVRKHLSLIHGGRLVAALESRGARSLTLLVSDVVGDDPSCIASGPTAPDPTTFATAAAVLARWLRPEDVPASVARHIASGVAGETPETPGADDLDWSHHSAVIIASIGDVAATARAELASRGFEIVDLGAAIEGDAADVACDHVAAALATQRGATRVALVGGGETTVRVPAGATGLGGRNQHLACVAARELDRAATRGLLAEREIVVASIATDGLDGDTDGAGGLVDVGTWRRAIDAGADPEALLNRFESRVLLDAASDLVVTGPTGTNVMDLHILLVAAVPEDATAPEAIA